MINESKLINLLFEGNENLVVQNGDRFHLEDYIQYFNKPGIIVATIKGDSECGIQQLPVGAVDNFRFMQVTDESAITEQEKNNGKTYEQILKEYEGEKNRVIDQWKKMNGSKYEGLKCKYGDKFLGMDIMENKKKIEHKEEDVEDDGMIKKDKSTQDEGRDKEELREIDPIPNAEGTDNIQEGILDGIKQFFQNKDIANEMIEQVKSDGNKGINAFSAKLLEDVNQNGKTTLAVKLQDGKTKSIYWDGDAKKSSTIMKFKGIQTLILYYSENDSETKKQMTVDNFDEVLVTNKINSMTKQLGGIYVVNIDTINGKTNSDEVVNKNAVINGIGMESDEQEIVLTTSTRTGKEEKDLSGRKKRFA